MKQRGATLIEVIFYSILVMMAMSLAAGIFYSAEQVSETVGEAYALNEDVEVAIRWMRQDLKSTALSTIRVFPDPSTESSEPPGASMASPYSYDSEDYTISKYGTPTWNKSVFYTVQATDKNVGKLVRWESKYQDKQSKQAVPLISELLPSTIEDHKKERVLLQQVAVANSSIPGLEEAGSIYGGFRIGFVRSDDSVSPHNPSLVSTGKAVAPSGNTRLVEVSLSCLTADGTVDKPSFIELKFRVAPDF